MDPSDSSQNRRKISAVSDVVEELSRRLLASPEQQPALFHAAQQVCSEELRLVRTGFHPAPFEELVERAIRLLPSAIGRDAFLEPEPFAEAAGPVAAPGPPEREPSAFESHESFKPPPFEAPAAAAASIRPLEIPKESPSAFPP